MTRYLARLGRDPQVMPSHPKSPQVIQTSQECQLRCTWPKKDIAAKLTDLADFNGIGQFFHHLAKVTKADKAVNSQPSHIQGPPFLVGVVVSLVIERTKMVLFVCTIHYCRDKCKKRHHLHYLRAFSPYSISGFHQTALLITLMLVLLLDAQNASARSVW